MQASDILLEQIVRRWVASYDPPLAAVGTRPESRGGPSSLQISPTNREAAPVSLWISDDDAHVSISVGHGLWWDGAVPLKEFSLRRLLEVIAAGNVREDVRKLFGRVVARRGTVGDPSTVYLVYGQLNPFSIIPGLQWHAIEYKPYRSGE